MSSALQSPAPTLKRLQEQLRELRESLEPVTGRNSLRSLTSFLEKRVERVVSSSSSAEKETSSSAEALTTVLTGRLQSAQLQSSMAYILLDLVWILLKIDGTDPQSHPVAAELKRVQLYLQKVHQADKRKTDDEQDKRAGIDGDKAKRFIKGALGGSGAGGKRTIFAEDGTIEKIVDAGETEETKEDSEAGQRKAAKRRSGEKENEKSPKKTKKVRDV